MPNPTVSYSSANAIGFLTFAPLTNANGTATITVTASDGALENGTTNRAFTVTANPVNDPPSFTKGPDQPVKDDAGPQRVVAWATGISSGPLDESGQTRQFTVTNDMPALFAVPPAVDPDGTLTYEPKLNTNGIAIVTVRLKDNGGTLSGGVDRVSRRRSASPGFGHEGAGPFQISPTRRRWKPSRTIAFTVSDPTPRSTGCCSRLIVQSQRFRRATSVRGHGR